MSKVILAKNAGFCFGVQRAVEEALKIQRQYNKKIYTLGPLIHNNDVVTYLEHNKIFSVDLKEIDTLDKGEVIVIRSHGVSESVVKTLEEHQLIVINATCPFVTNIQKKVRKFSEDGYKIVILGDENHPEVIGINGWCDDKAIITKDGNFDEKVMSQKVCAVSQTTEKEETWKKTVENLTVGSKELLAFNTICSATEVRQKSAKELSQVVDVMIVVGGKNSSNTTKLYEIAKGNCKNTIHIENKKELSEDFIKNNKNKSIGITAGASTPDWVIREVVEIMEDNQVKMDDQLALMNSMDKSFKVGDEVEGEILSKTRDGLMISLVGYGRDGIIPNREITSSLDNQGVIDSLNIGDLIKAKIIKLRNDDGYAVLSRLEYEKEGTIKELDELYKSAEGFNITINDTNSYGLISHYKGVRLFVPISQIDNRFVRDITAYKGQEVTVRLIEFDRNNTNKIIASRRILIEEKLAKEEDAAWSGLETGNVMKGIVKRFTNFGVFVDVNGVDGLLHLSEISWAHVDNPKEYLNKGDVIDVKILDADRENKKLSLSIKALKSEPWANLEEKYPEGAVVLGEVKRITPFGVFIELEEGIDGLVHISKISHDKIDKIDNVLKVSDEVKAKILSVDKESKRIALSIKDV